MNSWPRAPGLAYWPCSGVKGLGVKDFVCVCFGGFRV